MMKKDESAKPKYGWGSFTPGFLQVFNGPKFFIFSLSMLTILKTFASGYLSQNIPTIEKRFSMTSQDLGIITASNDIPGLVLIGFVSYFGEHTNKIKWLGYGGLITGIGSLLSVLAHLIVGEYKIVVSNPSVSNTTGLCVPQTSTNVTLAAGCATTFDTEWYYMFIFLASQVLMGIGSMPLFSLGPAYIDENVQPKSVPVYIGVWYSATWLGPGLGFILGGYMSTVYVDVTLPEGVEITPLHPQWIGAWWLGFLIVGILNIVFSFIMLGFPRELPGAREMREEAMKSGILAKRDKNINGKVKELIPATIGLLKNATYMFNTLALTAGILYIQGSSAFLAKVVNLKFGLDYATIGTLLGAIFTPTGIFGIMLGGVICRFFNVKKSCKRAALLIFVMHCIVIWGGFVWKIPGCDNVPIAGVTSDYSNGSCVSDCGCTKAIINPVCGVDKKTYISSCDAGCMTRVDGVPSQCRCIATALNESSVTPGYCDRGPNCNNVVGFLLVIGIMSILIAIFSVPTRVVVLRCVPFNQRSYALGFQFVINKLLGFIPSPVMFGVVVDLSCRLWSESCGQRGACLLYDIEKLSNSFLILVLVTFGVSTLFYFLSYWFYKPENEEKCEEVTDVKHNVNGDIKKEPYTVDPGNLNLGYHNQSMDGINSATFETGL